jgi:hypothetical protein
MIRLAHARRRWCSSSGRPESVEVTSIGVIERFEGRRVVETGLREKAPVVPVVIRYTISNSLNARSYSYKALVRLGSWNDNESSMDVGDGFTC